MSPHADLRHALLDLTHLLQYYLKNPRPLSEAEWERFTSMSLLTLARARAVLDVSEEIGDMAYLPASDDAHHSLAARLCARRMHRHLPSRPRYDRRGPRL